MSAKKFILNPLCLSIMLMTGSVATVQATVIADSSVRQNINTVTNSNGSDTVNINAPSASGISHNKYSRFDVGSKGLILNNSKDSSLTSVAGTIAGNRNLNNSAAASVILNEVTSNRASKLEGNLEVAGQKAHVIIANPNGITCSGCDFINTSRNTLTTGKPIMDGNNLVGFNVQDGAITIKGNGMKDNYSEYTDLIARYIKVNGPIDANNLTLMAGVNNQVSIVDNEVVAKGEAIKNTYGIGIDVSNLGGMYANKITMIANHDGVGVRNAGEIISQSNLTIDSRGHISNDGGKLGVINQMTLTAGGNLDNNRGMVSAPMLTVNAKNINNTGVISSVIANLTAQEKLSNNNNAQISTGMLTVKADQVENNDSMISSSLGNLDITANSLTNTQSSAVVINDAAKNKGIGSANNLIVKAKTVKNSGQLLGLKSVSVTADGVDNKNGAIISNYGIDLKVKNALQMGNGFIQSSQGDVNINADSVNNADFFSFLWGLIKIPTTSAGIIFAGNDINYNVKQTVDNYTRLEAANAVNITTDKVFNNYAPIKGSTVDIKANGIYNGKAAQINANNLQAKSDAFIVNDGKITAVNNLTATAPEFYSAGQMSSNHAVIYAPVYENTGSTEGDFKNIASLTPEEPATPEVTPEEPATPEETPEQTPVTNPSDEGVVVDVATK